MLSEISFPTAGPAIHEEGRAVLFSVLKILIYRSSKCWGGNHDVHRLDEIVDLFSTTTYRPYPPHRISYNF